MGRVVPLRPRHTIQGWARINASAKFHNFAPWDANPAILIPACRRQIAINVSAARVRSYDELPLNAQLCRGCTAAVRRT